MHTHTHTQFTVCEASGHDWEISVDKTSLFKDALKGFMYVCVCFVRKPKKV